MLTCSRLLKLLIAYVLCIPSGTFASVFIDFETLPDGSLAPDGDPISGNPMPIDDAYAEWGIVFSSHAEGHPKFYDWYGSSGNFAITLASGGVGFVIIADFSPPAMSVSADVATAAGDSVEMRAWDDAGNLVGFVVSNPDPPGPLWWGGGAGTLSLVSESEQDAIARVEWRSSNPLAGTGIDNLAFEAVVPAPTTYIYAPIVLTGDPTPAGGTYDFGGLALGLDLTTVDSYLFLSGIAGSAADRGIFRSVDGLESAVVTRGQTAPIGGSFTYLNSRFEELDDGRVLFVSPTSGGEYAVFQESNAAFSVVTRRGDPAPGGGYFGSFVVAETFHSTAIPFFSALSSTPGGPFYDYGSGVFLYDDPVVLPMVLTGDPTPIGGVFDGFYARQTLTASGELLFGAVVAGGSAGGGVFRRAAGGAISVVAADGDESPAGVLVGVSPGHGNAAGTVPLHAALEPEYREVLLVDGPDTVIATVGDPAPGGGLYAQFLEAQAAPDGSIFFFATLSETEHYWGWFRHRLGVTDPVVRKGDPSPVGGVFSGFWPNNNQSYVAEDGSMLFLADLEDAPRTSGLFIARPHPLQPGDVNRDGLVNMMDLDLLLGDWGPCVAPPEPCHADVNGDGDVGFADLLLLLANWG